MPASKPPRDAQLSLSLLLHPPYPATAAEGEQDTPAWEQVVALPFVDQARSPALSRAFYIPVLSAQHNRLYQYVLLRRRGGSGAKSEGHGTAQLQ